MKTKHKQNFLAAVLAGAVTLATSGAQAEDINTRVGKL